MVGVHVAVEGAQLGPQHALERDRGRLDDGDLEAALARGGCYLGSDPAGPDDDDTAAVIHALAQRVGIPDATQVEDSVEVCSRYREPAWLGSRREQQAVVAQPLAVVEGQLPASGVEAHCRPAQEQIDLVLGIEVLVVHVHLVAPDFAAQIVL